MGNGPQPPADKPTDQQAIAVFVLWGSGHFDTFDIGGLLGIGEAAVVRLLHAARHIRRNERHEGMR